MILRRKGRAHLEHLLGHAEQVVRVSPADVLVLLGVSDQLDPKDMEALPGLLADEGLECRGVIALGQGMTIDSIDLEEMMHLDRLAAITEQGANVVGRSTVNAGTVMVACPRCDNQIPITVSVHLVDDSETVYPFATMGKEDLALHQVVCAGSVVDNQ